MLYKLKNSSENNFALVLQRQDERYSTNWFIEEQNGKLVEANYRVPSWNIVGLKLREVNIWHGRPHNSEIVEDTSKSFPSLELLVKDTICYIPKKFLIELSQEEEEDIPIELNNIKEEK